MRARLLLSLVTAAAIAGGGAWGAQAAWTRHVTTAGFTVDRPPGWTSVGTSTDRLEIVSARCRPHAAPACNGEAEILVSSEPFAGAPSRAKACWNLTETVSEVEEAGRRAQVSRLSCTIGARRFLIVERHWKGDKRAASYSRIAMRMAKSLRYPG